MTDIQQAAQQALECIERLNLRGFILADFEDEVDSAINALREALAQPEQRKWVGLTDEEIWKGLTDVDWSNIMDRRDTALDTFQQGAVWAADILKERNHG